MKSKLAVAACLMFALTAGVPAWSQSAAGQTSADQNATSNSKAVHPQKQGRSAGGDIGSGSGDIGKGTAKGAGNLAAGTGKGAADLATLHPIDAAGDVGKGGVKAGKNVGAGAAKGTAKIGKGTGRGIKHIF